MDRIIIAWKIVQLAMAFGQEIEAGIAEVKAARVDGVISPEEAAALASREAKIEADGMALLEAIKALFIKKAA